MTATDTATTAADLRPGDWFRFPDNPRSIHRVVSRPVEFGSWRRVRFVEVEVWGTGRIGGVHRGRRRADVEVVPLTAAEAVEAMTDLNQAVGF